MSRCHVPGSFSKVPIALREQVETNLHALPAPEPTRQLVVRFRRHPAAQCRNLFSHLQCQLREGTGGDGVEFGPLTQWATSPGLRPPEHLAC